MEEKETEVKSLPFFGIPRILPYIKKKMRH